MDKDTKLIFAILAIIAILVGVFIWKVVTPKEEQDIINTVNLNKDDIEQNLIDDDLSNADWLKKFDNELIISFLERNLEQNKLFIEIIRTLFVASLVVVLIVIVVKFNAPNLGPKIGKGVIIVLLGFTVAFGIYTMNAVFTNNAIENAIENKSWYMEKDIVKRVSKEDGKIYVHLKKYGKQVVTSLFSRYDEGDEVEILIVKGKFGGKYEIGIR